MRAILFTAAVLLLNGCIFPCGNSCPPPEPIRSDILAVVPDLTEVLEDPDNVDDLVSGEVEITDSQVVLTYTDVDGNRVQVTWSRTPASPQG